MKNKATQRTKRESMQQKVQRYLEAETELLKKHGLMKRPIIAFPRHTKAPLFGRLGAWLARKSGGILDVIFVERKTK